MILQGKLIDLVNILRKGRISITCVQETKWISSKARDVNGYMLRYLSSMSHRNILVIFVDKDRLMSLKFHIRGSMFNVIVPTLHKKN